MADNANNSTLSFGTVATGKVKSISYKVSGAKIDVTALTDAQKLYHAGIPDKEITFDVVGVSALTVGQTAALTINWADGSTTSVAKVVVVGNDITGSVDSALGSSLTVAPTP